MWGLNDKNPSVSWGHVGLHEQVDFVDLDTYTGNLWTYVPKHSSFTSEKRRGVLVAFECIKTFRS